MACPSRRTLGRAGPHGLATRAWWPHVLGCGLSAAGSPWGSPPPPPPGISRAPFARTELPCSLMPQLQAPASSPPLPSASEKLVSGPEEGPHTTTWFGVVMGCDPGRGLSLALAGYGAPGAGAWERQWGGWAGVPGEQSEGILRSVGRGKEQGAIPEGQGALCRRPSSGVWLQQPRP